VVTAGSMRQVSGTRGGLRFADARLSAAPDITGSLVGRKSGNAIEVPGLGALNAGGDAIVNSVSCAAAGNCAAGGSYKDGSGHIQAFVVSQA
jgi:hypothetical protein